MKKWYVVQVYAGYEDQVEQDLVKQIEKSQMEDLFGKVLIPSAKIKSFFAEDQDQKLFPGYVLVEMELLPESIQLVKSTPRVLKFLGGKDPMPLSKKEVDRITATVKGEVSVVSSEKVFTEGTEVDIVSGPFSGFVGIIERVDESAERLTVMVSIFGRMTPVELSYNQVKS
jgi:transcription termination/antitermination protein NusG